MTGALEPGISIIMPCRNGRAFLREALESLRHPLISEIVFVDDGSTDGSAELARSLDDGRLNIVPGPQSGFSAAMNTGFLAARHAYCAECDADDIFVGERLVRQAEILDSQPEVIAVSSAYCSMTPAGEDIVLFAADREPGPVQEILMERGPITHFCSYLFRTQVLRDLGLMRTWFPTGSDIDLQLRLALAGTIVHLPEKGYRYRLHDQSITHEEGEVRNRFYWDAAREFARQRQERGSDDLEDGTPPAPPERPGVATGAQRLDAREQAAGHLEAGAWRAFADGRRSESLRLMFRSVRAAPTRRRLRGMAALLARVAVGGRRG